MRGMLKAGQVAALFLGVLLLGSGIARTAAAFEWELPGERKLSIHGFYESRLLFVGSELPVNGATWSSLRQVLSTEVELTLFPDGFGPFDSMFMFSRFLISYDCIYHRACGTANSADSYVGPDRAAVRQPLSLAEDVKNRVPYFAGLLEQTYRPGSLVGSQEELNPGRRYRDCLNEPGVFSNPFPLAVFCNLNSRSPLDSPTNQTENKFAEVRAGTFSPLTRPSLTAAARPRLGEEEYKRLQDLLIAGSVLTVAQNAQRSALLAESSEASLRGDDVLAATLNAEAAALLGPASGPGATFDANIPTLLGTRPDVNRFAVIADDMAPELLTAQWGSSELRQLVWPFLASINTPIQPGGYFAGGKALDTIGEYDQALGENQFNAMAVPGENRVNDGFAVYTSNNAQAKANPFFVGPDGIRDNQDDLPFVTNNPAAQSAGYSLSAPIPAGDLASFDGTFGRGSAADPRRPLFAQTAKITVPAATGSTPEKTVELYGVYSPEYLTSQGCRLVPGASYSRRTGQCLRGAEDVSAEALPRGCTYIKSSVGPGALLNVGTNGDGQCILLNTDVSKSATALPSGQPKPLPFEVIALWGDPRARPGQAQREPLDATDFRSVADGGPNNTLPGRPRAADNGIYFQSPGMREQYEKYGSALVTNLDLKFSVDQLQWNHGANQQQTHEFAEGYLEMEMADSQIYARVGKLIVVWGKTELFRNQDRNNPLDIGNGIFAPLEEQRVGQWAIDLTFSPEAFMRVGPVEDLRLEILTIFNEFEPTDLGKCAEGTAVDLICLKSFGSMANGMAGIGVIGELRPYNNYSGVESWDFGARLEGRFDRFTFAVSDFYGWDDAFYLDLVQQYERTSDTETGAPLAVGHRDGGQCRVRTNSEGQRIGPNGIAGDTDDDFPSDGECLLWNPPDAEGRQTLRSTDAIASLQNVNQTLFHSLCAYTFDSDEGYCAFDRLNYPLEFGFISNLVAGYPTIGSVVTNGVETIVPTSPDGHTSVTQRGSPDILSTMFLAIEPMAFQAQRFQDVGFLQVEQAALLGCGAAYASPCGAEQQLIWTSDQTTVTVIEQDLTRDAELGISRLGGIDLMNADASIVTQEFVGLKALSAGALVGTKLGGAQGIYYQAGMNYSRNGQRDFDVDNDFWNDASTGNTPGQLKVQPDKAVHIETGEYLRVDVDGPKLTPDYILGLGETGRARLQIKPGAMIEADGWIEPMPWTVNDYYLKTFGAIVFNADPRNPLDLTSTANDWNTIGGVDLPNADGDENTGLEYSDIDGEYCARWTNTNFTNVITPFNMGCTGLEAASANFERLLITTEIIGFDRVFDAPESLQELSNWAQSNTAKQAAGDPISGPDGIFARNQFVLRDDEVDFEVITGVPTGDSSFVLVPVGEEDPQAAGAAFLLSYFPEEQVDEEGTRCASDWCYLQVNNVLTDPDDVNPNSGTSLILAMPIGFEVDLAGSAPLPPTDEVCVGNPGDARCQNSRAKVNLARLQYLQQTEGLGTLRHLLASETVNVEISPGVFEDVEMTVNQRLQLLGEFNSQTNRGRDMDGDFSTDLDRNRDAIWDGQDDYLLGPITDDNILCGSGIPGDLLQDGVQYSPYKRTEDFNSEAFKSLFPNGLPPRSPVFCRGVSGILSATTQTLPVRRAGGDGSYGRRDFLWQGGRQVEFNYQKRNVFGMGLDFAEDVTKTSWGLEFSWMANKLFANNLEYSGLSKSDELVLSISVDRPTFFNFLNPNRSFFLNLQMFLRYLPSYEGGRGNEDGNYGVAGAPLTGNIAFTFFTGYFQDRLAPRVTILYAPWESQGAVITGLTYRWNDAFSTSIGYTQFFGHIYEQQGGYFPISQYGSVADYSGPVLRGVAPVLYRDQAELRVRYTW